MDSLADVLERAKVREVAGVFHSRSAIEDAVDDLLLNGFDRADIDQLASQDKVRKRLKVYVAPEEMAGLTLTPRQPAFKHDDITMTLTVAAGLLGATAGSAVVFGVVSSGVDGWSAGILGALVGLGAGAVGALVMVRVFRHDDLRGLESLQFDRGVVI